MKTGMIRQGIFWLDIVVEQMIRLRGASPVHQQVLDLDRHFQSIVVAAPQGMPGSQVVSVKLQPLTSLAEELAESIPPMRPPDQFRDELGRALLDAHRQQIARRSLGAVPQPPQPIWRPVYVMIPLLLLGLWLLFRHFWLVQPDAPTD